MKHKKKRLERSVSGQRRHLSREADQRPREYSDSEDVVEFLASPGSYPHAPASVSMVETHISWVFIASPFVFKVKKPVNLGFLDFSTLDKRLHFCEREVELNRRLCPEIYLDVVPIYKTAAGFSFKAEGARLEDLEKLNAAYEPPAELASDLLAAGDSISETAKTLLLQLSERQLR